MFGEEKNKKALVKDLRKQGKVIKLERSKDFIIVVIEQPIISEPAYDPRIIRPAPIVINKAGYHIWELASFKKELLSKVIHAMAKYSNFEILKFRKEKISNISFTKLLPNLTDKQKKALEIAIQNGYYNYPKNTKIK